MTAIPRVVLVGMHGHGQVHLAGLLQREQAGRLELCGLADVRPPTGPAADVLHGRAFATRPQELLARLRPDIAVLATPMHTHAELAGQAMAHGAHVLLEKPPVTSVAEHHRLTAAADTLGRHCQVGFQALGSSAVRDLSDRLARGELGAVQRIGVVGCWRRDADYYTRSRWAGRRTLDGTVVADGALTNPFAHGIALALALAGPEPAGRVRAMTVEPYHAYPIETDDTASARIETHGGVPITVAVTLCAARESEPYVQVHATGGTATLWYTEDRLRIDTGGGTVETVGSRVDLLDDLIAHLGDDPRADVLRSPLRATLPFTEVLEAVQRGPAARPIPERHLAVTATGRTIPGIEEAVARAGATGLLFSELGLDWAPKETP